MVAAGGTLADVAAVGLHADVKPPEAVDAVVRVVRRLREQTQARTPQGPISPLLRGAGCRLISCCGCYDLLANQFLQPKTLGGPDVDGVTSGDGSP